MNGGARHQYQWTSLRHWPHSQISILKYPFSFSTKTKQNILPALWFWVCFHLSILMLFGWKCILFDMFLPIIHTKTPKNGNGNNSIWRFLWHPFQKLPFSPIHARNNGFSRLHFWNDSMMKVFVSVIRHFSVDDRQKHIKKYAFLYENTFVWWGPHCFPKGGAFVNS